MAEFSVGRIARRGFGGVLNAHGRDDRMQFWIFCALVFGPLMVVQFVTQIVLTFPSFDTLASARPGDPEAGRRMVEAQMQGMIGSAYANIGIFLIGALLLTAAAARRLHDRGRSGWWALVLPFGLFAVALGQARRVAELADRMPAFLEKMKRQPGNMDALFDWAAQANRSAHGPDWTAIVGGLLLIWLLIELARPGTAGPNRFGPPPE